MTPLKKGQQPTYLKTKEEWVRKKKSTALSLFSLPLFLPCVYYFQIISEYFFSQEELYLNPPEMFKEIFSMKLAVEDLR